ncbi:LPS O-antigen chain length determinant protein WzzB [Salmonella enterica]|uniref:Chain length determinant protein n=1 Tax=Salmonella enterica subsp. enterica serovar Heidelberg TaxID=611 RepID=A0A5I7YBS1_SALET|nr:LPS O-antigen chain length determinant protein WzzB [Salmonella enterica]EDP9502388.1 LPS O-antigen chain length determinant protein WzzB [Salmonella enterica subsp. enterica serovar Heidelberg str. CFSAN003485]EDV9754334.1 LPS O-antigen chain length determinant protein WzzB [Salmonella enterica subsp. enterica serovar Heidelberg str. CFSAN003470]EBW0218895.1 LPS O-antigen chain length determinant protein WzzB [Salmonella enterica subsp. enterica serovar Heidelberg]EBW5870118.1 LPS O-antigen
MTVDSNTSSGRGNDPEQIDLIELLLQLWRGKMTIIVAVIIAILLAVGYLMIAKEKWTSTAIITQPDAAQVATYTNALNVLYGGNAPKISEVQANFISRFSSAFSALSEVLDNQKEREKLTIEQSVKGQALPLSVSYVSTTAEGAQRRLAEYIQQVDEEVAKELEVDALKSMIQNEATRPLVFSPAYYQTKQTLLDIKNLKVTADTVHVYRYVMKPTLPVRRDSPKTAITLVLAVLLGGMIGAGIVLGRNALRSYKPKAL